MPLTLTITPFRSSAREARLKPMATTKSLLQDALDAAAASRDSDLEDLMEELRIPSVSTLPERHEDCLRNAKWLRDRFERLGMKAEIVDVMDGGLPVVIADWNGRPGQPHLTMYGHYDVQPPDPLDEWKSPPFEPEGRGDDIFARGAVDDKGQVMIQIKAVEGLLKTTGKLPVNVKFLLEGEEETGGAHIEAYVR